jgi:hypothetical protein
MIVVQTQQQIHTGKLVLPRGIFVIYKPDWKFYTQRCSQPNIFRFNGVDMQQLIANSSVVDANPSQEIMDFVTSLRWNESLEILREAYGDRESANVEKVVHVPVSVPAPIEPTRAEEVAAILRKAAAIDKREKKKEEQQKKEMSTWTKVGKKA